MSGRPKSSSVWDLRLPQIPYRRLNLPDEVICNKLPPHHACRALVSPACFPVCRRLCAYPWGGWPLTHPISSFLRSLIPYMHAAPFSYCPWLLFLLFPLCCHLPSLFLAESSPKAGKDACLALSGGLVSPWGYKIQLMSSLRQTGFVTVMIYVHYQNSITAFKAQSPQTCIHTHTQSWSTLIYIG